MTQEDLAREVGVGVRIVTKWEKGTVMPRMKNMRKLAAVTDCKVDDLVTDDDVDAATARALENLAATLMVALGTAIRETQWDGVERRLAGNREQRIEA